MQTDQVEIIGNITQIEVIAAGHSIRELDRLQRKHGRGRWRKLKGWRLSAYQTTRCILQKSTGMKRMEMENVT